MILSNVRFKFFAPVGKTPMNCIFSENYSHKKRISFRFVEYNGRQLFVPCIDVATSRNMEQFQGNNRRRKMPIGFWSEKRHWAIVLCYIGLHPYALQTFEYHFMKIYIMKTCWNSLSTFLLLNWIKFCNILVKFFASLELHHCKSLEISFLWIPPLVICF